MAKKSEAEKWDTQHSRRSPHFSASDFFAIRLSNSGLRKNFTSRN
jgi:hypothetical protein